MGTGLIAWSCADAGSNEPVERRAQPVSETRQSYYVVLEGAPAVSAIPAGIDPRSEQATPLVKERLRAIETEQSSLRPALEQQGALVIAELTRLANALHVLATPRQIARIARLGGVERVEKIPLVFPTLQSLIPVVGAPTVWANTTPYTGDGVTVGIIDTGIDYTHADFGGPGTVAAYTANDSKIIETGSFPTARVVGGWDFVGDDYNPSANADVPQPDADPLDCSKPELGFIAGGHGSHVAGIAGGNGVKKDGTPYLGPYNVSFNPASYKIAPGVAPQSKLYALRVFGCDGSTTMLGSALERASDPNQDGSFADRLDVVNGSLGTGYALGSPTLAQVAANLTKVGTLVVAAAGNDGQTFYTIASPGSIPEVLSVAASADNDFFALSVTSVSSGATKYPAAEGIFSKPINDAGPVSGELVLSQPANGCSPFSNAANMAGKLALVDRGVCAFVTKFENAVAAGAKAVVIVDNVDQQFPSTMSGDSGAVSIPGVMITLDAGTIVKQLLAQGTVTAGLDPSDKYTGAGAELLAGFSSRGPSAVDQSVKPEIAAPGASVVSAGVGSGSEARLSQGTSQASPAVTGAAALVRQARPSFGPLEVKAVLMNSTEPVSDLSSQVYGSSIMGSGRVAVERAVLQQITAGADVASGRVGAAFGSVVSDVATNVERSITLTNHAATEATLDAKVEPTFAPKGVTLKVEPAQVKVAAGQSASVKLSLSFDPVAFGSPGPDPLTSKTQSQTVRQYLNEASGNVRLSHTGGGAQDVLVPYHGSLRAAAKRQGTAPSECGASADPSVDVTLEGASAHPNPVVTAFQLGTTDPELSEAATDPSLATIDLRAIGAATDLATAASFDEAQVFFAVAVTGEWTTPARGPLSVVAIQIDSDNDGAADFTVRAEARNKQQFFRDALSSATYQVGDETRIRRLPLNLVAPDKAETHPFNNSVLVFTALLSDLALTAENAAFSYFASTEDPVKLLEGEQTAWATFDANKPLVDTTAHGQDGLPLFVGPGPVKVNLSAEARAGGAPLELLLLHHTNVAGSRFEVLSLTPTAAGDLALAASAAESVRAGETTDLTLTVTNAGTTEAKAVKLSGTLTGGTLVAANASQGSCSELACDLGDMAAGATATITATVRGDGGVASLSASADVTSELACEATLANNTAKATLAVVTTKQKKPVYTVSGGCGCRTAPAREAPLAWLGLGALGVLALRRRHS